MTDFSLKYNEILRHDEIMRYENVRRFEVVELADILKKIDRGDFGAESVKKEIANDLGDATMEKFNIVSDRIKSEVKL